MANTWEVFVIEFARSKDQPLDGLISGAHDDGVVDLPFSFVLAKSGGKVVLVDTGFSAEALFERRDREEVLRSACVVGGVGRVARQDRCSGVGDGDCVSAFDARVEFAAHHSSERSRAVDEAHEPGEAALRVAGCKDRRAVSGAVGVEVSELGGGEERGGESLDDPDGAVREAVTDRFPSAVRQSMPGQDAEPP